MLTLALESGIRHIDTALMYRSHKQVSYVLANFFASGKLTRDDIFITSKIFHPPTFGFGTAGSSMPENLDLMTPQQVTERVTFDFERTLEELGLGYIDLMLLHWPSNFHSTDVEGNAARRLAAWNVLEKMYEKGWARAIGVSNFSEHHLERLKNDGAVVVPMVNQIEASVFMQWTNITSYCKENDIRVHAYSPLGRGVTHVTSDPIVLSVAQKYDKDAGQIALRYLLQLDYGVTFLSTSESRLTSNQQLYDFELDDNDMMRLSSLNVPDGTWGLVSPYDIS